VVICFMLLPFVRCADGGAGDVNIHSIRQHLRSLINIETNAYTSYIQLWRVRYAKLTILPHDTEITPSERNRVLRTQTPEYPTMETAMTFKHTLLAAGLAAGAMAAAPAAFAQAFATFGPLTYEVIDLKPDDGITPTFSLTESSRSGSVSVFDNFNFEGPPAASASITSGGTATANFQGTATATSLPESVSANVDMINGSGTALAEADYTFQLAPNARLIFTSPATVGGGFHFLAGDGHAVATLSGSWFMGFDPHIPFGDFDTSLNSPGLIGGGSATLSGVVNSSEEAVFGHVHLRTSASGERVSLVPEPASVAMLVAGLGLMGGVAQRRRRAGPRPRV